MSRKPLDIDELTKLLAKLGSKEQTAPMTKALQETERNVRELVNENIRLEHEHSRLKNENGQLRAEVMRLRSAAK